MAPSGCSVTMMNQSSSNSVPCSRFHACRAWTTDVTRSAVSAVRQPGGPGAAAPLFRDEISVLRHACSRRPESCRPVAGLASGAP
jgi:hypothetical protein